MLHSAEEVAFLEKRMDDASKKLSKSLKERAADAAHEATLAGRVAVQVKQRELQAVAADFQKELVKFRTVVRIALGTSHLDFQRLRLRNARPETEDADESAPATADSSSNADGASEASVPASTDSTT